jgi:hypothetical protein
VALALLCLTFAGLAGAIGAFRISQGAPAEGSGV